MATHYYACGRVLVDQSATRIYQHMVYPSILHIGVLFLKTSTQQVRALEADLLTISNAMDVDAMFL